MTSPTPTSAEFAALRAHILSDPQIVLGDREILQALVEGHETSRGDNVVDMRGLAMDKLEERLGRLEDLHQSLISAAYDNVSTTRQVHRAILLLTERESLPGLVAALGEEVNDCLRLLATRLLVEQGHEATERLSAAGPAVVAVTPGFISDYQGLGRRRDVVLRRVSGTQPAIYGEVAPQVQSEALLRLDLGDSAPVAALALGAKAPDQYLPSHATDLMEVFLRVAERLFRDALR
ncbi:MAG: DUF484 family protein [Mangrovicoccus sp.]